MDPGKSPHTGAPTSRSTIRSKDMIIPPKRTNRDLLFHAVKSIGGPLAGSALLERFKQDFGTQLLTSRQPEQEISEAEFKRTVAQIDAELPAFLHWLRRTDFPDTGNPPDRSRA